MRPLTDEALATALKHGDETAMEALVHRYYRQLYAYLYRLTCNRSTADDLVQEVFLRLCTRLDTYKEPHPFKAWIYTVAHNVYRDHVKSAYQRRVVTGELPASAAGPTPLDLLEHQADRQVVIEALGQLPEPQRQMVVLRYYHHLKLDEIAAVTGVPSGTVKSRLNHALHRLRELLGMAAEGGDRHDAGRAR